MIIASGVGLMADVSGSGHQRHAAVSLALLVIEQVEAVAEIRQMAGILLFAARKLQGRCCKEARKAHSCDVRHIPARCGFLPMALCAGGAIMLEYCADIGDVVVQAIT
jgi:hypothetical protein